MSEITKNADGNILTQSKERTSGGHYHTYRPIKPIKRRTVQHPVQLVLGLLFSLLVMLSPLWLNSAPLRAATGKAALISGMMQLPPSGEEGILPVVMPFEEGEVVSPTVVTTTTTAEPTTTTVTTTTTTAVPSPSDSVLKPVCETRLGNSGTQTAGIYIRNSTGYKVDAEAALKSRADCKIKLNAGYQVLIIHTHTTESYALTDSDTYDTSYSPRTADKSRNVIAVGNVIAEKLESVGIKTLHVTTVHDYPQYNGSYNRAEETIKEYLEQYPSIEMVIDVHRDAMTKEDGAKIKPTVEIDGKKAAQVMIITGCDNHGKLVFPEWRKNFIMAVQLQKKLYSDNGLMRPLYFAPFRYNMHLTPNSLLIEFGTDVNTLEEALYSAEMVGKGLAELLLEYDVAK